MFECESCGAHLDDDESLCDECFRVLPNDVWVSVETIKYIKEKEETEMTTVGNYLDAHGYRNVAEWALDSDYQYDESTDLWTDEEGYIIDPYGQLLAAIESAQSREVQ